ncbi:hypothetical protein ABE65_010450 [Fictibacillus phosphorivorans]|uniref:Uncharacterized protein n=1 Tax=Fictibacillus phosphorivorans TaxID=1221500 RepID=A0A160IN19_9BACL|nr:hypothetical protein [Fictibacillus phosphorivorans]ANC77200.1 hypothetical protein ABE65_010450 [Fictibacillus phosphorivorans]
MDIYKNIQHMLYAHTRQMEQLMKATNPYENNNLKFLKEIPKLEIPTIEIPKIEIPEIKLPKFNLPEINYDRIKIITNSNSRYGWTLTGEMYMKLYLNEELLKMKPKDVDQYFLDYYNYNDQEHYKKVKDTLIKKVERKWRMLLEECFQLYENNQYKTTIPTLITVIEGQVSFYSKSGMVGGRLVEDFKKTVLTDEEKFTAIAGFSLYKYFKNSLFKTRDFDQHRLPVINRNWILHGRDDPSKWTKIDFIRLINVIATMLFIFN